MLNTLSSHKNRSSFSTPEIYYHCNLSYGKNFDLEDDGICCEVQILHNQDWNLVNKIPTIQTHVSYKNEYNGEYV